jgi:predicted ATPase
VGWAEVDRIAGEIALMSPDPDVAKVEAYLERALAVARKQQAKSWELRAAMSMARLWRDLSAAELRALLCSGSCKFAAPVAPPLHHACTKKARNIWEH